jgi:hypothetical protein
MWINGVAATLRDIPPQQREDVEELPEEPEKGATEFNAEKVRT